MVTSKPKCQYMSLLFCRFYKVELKLSYRSSHLKRYKVKQLRKMFKKESKESNCLLSCSAIPFRQCLCYETRHKVRLGPKEIYGLFVPPGKAYTLFTEHLITGLPLRSVPVYEKWFQVKLPIHISSIGLEGWLYFKHLLDIMTSHKMEAASRHDHCC